MEYHDPNTNYRKGACVSPGSCPALKLSALLPLASLAQCRTASCGLRRDPWLCPQKIRVVPRGVVFRYKIKSAAPLTAAPELSVRAVVSGRVFQHKEPSEG